MRAAIALALYALVARADAKPKLKNGAWAIQRQTAVQLPAKASFDEVQTLLTGSPWRQPNPNKETSTWESHWFTFAKDGTVERSGDLARDTVKMSWKLVSAGTKPVVQIEHAKLTLERCARMDGSETICLFGKPPS